METRDKHWPLKRLSFMRLEAKNGMKLDIDIIAEGGKNKPKLAIAYCPHLDSLHET
jgi:hypothetical protein